MSLLRAVTILLVMAGGLAGFDLALRQKSAWRFFLVWVASFVGAFTLVVYVATHV